ncbi:MAG: DUF2142 domain-containing protein [Myxococcaceae bacterium]
MPSVNTAEASDSANLREPASLTEALLPRKQSEESARAARWFLFFALPLGAIVFWLTPPFQAPDEQQHFWRAYAISEGHLFAHDVNGHGGNDLPRSVHALPGIVGMDDLAHHGEARVDLARIRAGFAEPLNSKEREDVQAPSMSVYFPHSYLPQSIGMAVGRAVLKNPLQLYYVGRFAGMLAIVLLLALAIRITPVQPYAFAAAALLPMCVFQRSAISADGMTTAVGFLYLAYILRLSRNRPQRLSTRELVTLFALGVAIAISKQTYAVLALAFLLIPEGRLPSRRTYWLTFAGLGLAMFAISGMWAASVAHLYDAPKSLGIDVQEQTQFLKSHPGALVPMLARTLWSRWDFYLTSAVGGMGSLDCWLPTWALWTLIALLGAIALADGSRELTGSARIRLVAIGTFFIATCAIIAALYVAWTAVGAKVAEGVQGRYFLPIVPLALVGLLDLGAKIRARLSAVTPERLLWAFGALSSVTMVWTLITRYYA